MARIIAFRCARCDREEPPRPLVSHCPCGGPLRARYDLASLKDRFRRSDLSPRPPGVWRYREVLPGCEPIRLGEGGTPLLPVPRLGAALGLRRLYVKDEGQNPTASFKARGSAVAVAAARAGGARALAIASAGNAASGLAAYAARAGLEAHCYLPVDTPPVVQEEIRAYGARIYPIDGPLSEAGGRLRADAPERGWFDISTFREPYRLEGKKTMGYELAEQLDGELPDWIFYPTGGGMGLMGLWKAFDEMEALGWIDARRPRLVAVQAAGCAPLARAFREGAAAPEPWGPPATIAVGLRVPVCGAGDILLRILRESGGRAVTVDEEGIRQGARELGRREGVCAGPEGGAALAALRDLRSAATIGDDDRVVLFNTGWGGKYVDTPGGPE